MSDGYRQEVFNVLLAQLLAEGGIVAAPENILKLGPERRRRMPDVMVDFQGLRTIIEGEVDDQPKAREKALASATKRVEEGIAFIGIGVVYPAHLREIADFSILKDNLAESKLDIAIVSEAGERGYARGNIDDLERALRSAFRQLVKEDVVAEAVAKIDAAVEKFAAALSYAPGSIGRLAAALNICDLPPIGQKLSLPDKVQGSVSRISGLVMINAMIFQEVLSQHDTSIPSLHDTLELDITLSSFSDPWKLVIQKIII